MKLTEVQERIANFPIYRGVRLESEVPVLYQYVSSLVPGQVYLEIGTAMGHSAVVAALSSPDGVEVWTLDNGDRYRKRFGSNEAYEREVLDVLARYGVQDKVHFRLTRSDAMPWERPIQVLFVDGGHDYKTVVSDIAIWTPFVPVGGVAVFHDYNPPRRPGVTQAVDELMTLPVWRPLGGEVSIYAFGRARADG